MQPKHPQTSEGGGARRRRVPRDPRPRFKLDDAEAMAACERLLPQGHLARSVWRGVQRLDVSSAEARYSALGQRGFPPRRLLAVWVYASLTRRYEATEVARALETDAALRWLAGGHAISRPVLDRFRREGEVLFRQGLAATVGLAHEAQVLDLSDVACDSVRLRAAAGVYQMRRLEHSRERLGQLGRVEVQKLTAEERERHARSVRKHTEAVRACEELGVSTWVCTSPAAGVLKFPTGQVAPGHRVQVSAAGAQLRLVLACLMGAEPNDNGLLGPLLEETRRTLRWAGSLPAGTRLSAVADTGYASRTDLCFAAEARGWVDVLVPELPERNPRAVAEQLPRRDFRLDVPAQRVTCPAGRPMQRTGRVDHNGLTRYQGVGCSTCPLRARCTSARSARSVYVDWEAEPWRAAMRKRWEEEGARERYARRAATVEPVFSLLQHPMGFRRVCSRLPRTVRAEVLLKLLAYNISRLVRQTRLFCALIRRLGAHLFRATLTCQLAGVRSRRPPAASKQCRGASRRVVSSILGPCQAPQRQLRLLASCSAALRP